ncbi:AAA-ATPase At4g30250 [Selaginella moellendorffii]|uniref:AAA-ATPase At4g30250 n=1 Tax=Selaginella moellendorffii TaxID=88036 RepID=UPI000D1D0EE6|nr:AAA-ATPase At4g30250 [Selaginella moellendorffii]|eukprot:XP_024541034.1 AAA-ATPase At4g30250 [Selaginella moellendorffii]
MANSREWIYRDREKCIIQHPSLLRGCPFATLTPRFLRGALSHAQLCTLNSLEAWVSLVRASGDWEVVIANYTQYDVYDMELTEVQSNADLRKLLMGISNKAIIVIEDIDCSLELKKRGKPAAEEETEEKDGESEKKNKKKEQESSRVTLSGLLNFIDALWSCSRSERIIIFTTNHKEDLDPVLLRSGRMDLHIFMGYYGFEAFKVLAWTHLEISQQEQFEEEFGEIEELIAKVEITPADIAEVLIQNRGNSRGALEKVIEALQD